MPAKTLVLLVLCTALSACASAVNSPGWSYEPSYEPVCLQIKQEIMADEAVGKHAYEQNTAADWRCIRNQFNYGRITLVVQPEPRPYRLDLYFDDDWHIKKTDVQPAAYASAIGSMAMHARLDSLTLEAASVEKVDGLRHIYLFVR